MQARTYGRRRHMTEKSTGTESGRLTGRLVPGLDVFLVDQGRLVPGTGQIQQDQDDRQTRGKSCHFASTNTTLHGNVSLLLVARLTESSTHRLSAAHLRDRRAVFYVITSELTLGDASTATVAHRTLTVEDSTAYYVACPYSWPQPPRSRTTRRHRIMVGEGVRRFSGFVGFSRWVGRRGVALSLSRKNILFYLV